MFNDRYMRTRFIKFALGDTILNQQDIDDEVAENEEYSTRIVMEVQFAKPEDKSVMTLKEFKETTMNFFNENETISSDILSHFQADGTAGIILQLNCSESKCPIRSTPTCVNEDFVGVPEHLQFKHKNNSKIDFPYNITVVENGKDSTVTPLVNNILDAGVKVDKEYEGKVGETLDFVCRKNKKVFQTDDEDLKDNVLTIVCKTDRYYTVPSSGVSILDILNENNISNLAMIFSNEALLLVINLVL